MTEIPEEVFDLRHIKILDISGNQLTNIPESIGNLSNLNWLNLSENQLISLPESIGSLSNLTELYLYANQLTSLPESIGNLSNLTELNLYANHLINIPESIGNLSSLTELNLSKNQLTDIPESIGSLSNLTELSLSGNQLTNIPESIGNLSNLTKLYLSKNQLADIPESIGNLSNLTELYLYVNLLTNIPESIGNLSSLIKLDLYFNPLIVPPFEIANKGIKSIREYFRQLSEEGEDYIYEAKLLVVGEAGAGKTSLAKKIQNSNYQLREDQVSTEGIDVIKWSFPLDNERKFKVNIWDFGGQAIYHATHQFFLTRRSLYLLVSDNRKEDTDFYFWLNIVEQLSDNSPLLIIQNENQERKREINEKALRGQFTNIKEVLATNLKTNRGLENIITSIQYYLQNLPHIGQVLPKTWVLVRNFLESDDRDYISLQDFFAICEANGLTRHEDKLQLSRYLHDLGVCLHFQDEEDSLLYRTVILKPEWGTDAVYKVLDNKQVIDNQGCFTRNDLKTIWQSEKYASRRGELLELMKKFQLCYEIPDCKNTFIAPQLLSDKELNYDWNESENLILRYTYPDFMPKGIISRFIVAMHQYIDQQKYVWKTGVILNKDNTKAEVTEYYGKREIKIRIAGRYKRELLNNITYELDKIHDSYNRLKYSKLVPCNCYQCRDNQSPHFYAFDTLRNFIVGNQYEIQCQKSFQMVDVLSLIDDVVDLQKLIPEDNQDGKQIINIEQFNSISGDVQELVRKIMIDSGNYNERIEGNFYQQMGKFGIGHMSGGKIKYNTKVAGEINEPERQDLKQVGAEIQALLEQLEKTYPTNTTLGKVAIAEEAIQRINNDPQLTTKILSALKAGGTSALDSLLDHPAASFILAAIADWQQTKNS